MKPSILIFSQAMELGGVERSLLGLLDAIDYDRYDVDLFLMRRSGELMPYLNPKAKLLPEIPQYASLAVPMASLVKSGQLGVLRGRLKGKLAARRFDKQHSSDKPSIATLTYSHKYTLNSMPPISGKTYDLAISFLTPHYFARERVNAKKYAAWIHTDYTALTFDRSAELAMWEGYDAICGVSERASESFQSVFPELAQKVRTEENILPRELTCKQAAMPQTDMPAGDGISLLSVGRFCEAKNFDNVPDICRRLVAAGLDVKWYLIGYGGDEPLIRQKIDEAGMQERVIILGKKDNPYPYMRACDLYVQPSRYEGKAAGGRGGRRDRPHGQCRLRSRNCRAAARSGADAAAVGELRKERLYEQRGDREDLCADGGLTHDPQNHPLLLVWPRRKAGACQKVHHQLEEVLPGF